MERSEKKAFVEQLHQELGSSEVLVVAHYSGMTVDQMSKLRREMYEAGAKFRVSKNRLTKLAIKDTPFAQIEDMLKGPTAIAYSDDPISAPKVLANFAKQAEQLQLIGGAMGETRLDASGVKALASMPSLDELRGKIIGLLQAPAGKVASVVQAPAGQLARVVNAYAQKS